MAPDAHLALLGTVAITTTIWIAVAFLTPATNRDVLCHFYRSIRPPGPGWARVRRDCGEQVAIDSLAQPFAGWVFGCACVYGALFGTGYLLFGRPLAGVVLLLISLGSALYLRQTLNSFWGR